MLNFLKKFENPYFGAALSALSFPVLLLGILTATFLHRFFGGFSIVLTAALLFLFAQLHAFLCFQAIRRIFKRKKKLLFALLQLCIDLFAFWCLWHLILILYLGYKMAA